jgi:threonine synthase
MSAFSALHHLDCPRCGATHDATVLQGLCSRCASPLLARYDLSEVRATRAEVGTRPPDLWRYHELLPVSGPEHV